MPLFANSELIDLNLIDVDREDRDRKKVDISSLIPSVRRFGVLQPIIVEPKTGGRFELKAGERRLTTCQFLQHSSIPAIRASDLTELDRRLIELEENSRRENLTWQESCMANLRVHRLLADANPDKDWTFEDSADWQGYTKEHYTRILGVAEALEGGDTSLAQCDTLSQANTILARRRERAGQELLSQALDLAEDIGSPDPVFEEEDEAEVLERLATEQSTGVAPGSTRKVVAAQPKPTLVPFEILHASMIEWMDDYSGPRFNLMHCDLPYGVPLNGQAGQAGFEGGGYDSNPDLYWDLTKCICRNWDRVMLPSSHLLWWFSFNFYTETFEYLTRHIPGLVLQPTPLIWHKTDNKGILPDPMRMARNINEPCFYGATGDRKIVKPISNTYGAPTGKANNESIHTNEKPEPMLKHFMSMFVDEHSRVLDPTCGSGSSVRTAEALGAEAALGLEINEEFAERASARLRQVRNLAKFSAQLADAPLTSEKE